MKASSVVSQAIEGLTIAKIKKLYNNIDSNEFTEGYEKGNFRAYCNSKNKLPLSVIKVK